MKTAIIKTDFWKEDAIFQLTPDVRHFYLCILTNPERNTTPAFKCSDRLMSAYTGFNQDTILLCRKQLEEKGLIVFVDGFYVICNQDYVEPKTGRLTKTLYDKTFSILPDSIKELLLNRSSTAQEYIDIDSNIDIDKDINTEKTTQKKEHNNDISEVIKAFEKVDAKNRLYYANKTQRAACTFLIETYGKEAVLAMIGGIPEARVKVPYFPSVTTPCELRDKWVKIYEAVHRSNKSKKPDMEFV